jgi:hypothetical protein
MVNDCGKDTLLIPAFVLEVEKWPIASAMEPVRAYPTTGPPSPQNGMIGGVVYPTGHTDLSESSC